VLFKPIVEQRPMRFAARKAVSGGLTPNGQMRSPMIVLVFPLPQLLGQLGGIADNHSAVELVFVCSVAALHFAITFRTSTWDPVGVQPQDLADAT
jgi:hypothetical protein